LPGVLKLRFQ